jgi:hypothetical protein
MHHVFRLGYTPFHPALSIAADNFYLDRVAGADFLQDRALAATSRELQLAQ